MKKIGFSMLALFVATPALSGALVDPIVEQDVIIQEAASSSSGGLLIPLLLIVLLAAVALGDKGPIRQR